MNVTHNEEKRELLLKSAIELLPLDIKDEIGRITARRRGALASVNEIRLRADGKSVLSLLNTDIPLLTRIAEDELETVVFKACGGSLYAYRDTLADGYVPLEGGVRLGVCGQARYDGGRLVGVRGVRSLVFRFPFGECTFAGELAELFNSAVGSGMLIYAPPGGGKTTALRSLVRELSRGAGSKRVCVVDERCEFSPESYVGCSVDILRGYKRAHGIELATRTLSPEIIVIDEIGSDELCGLESVIRCGIPAVATAHASSMEELMSKPHIKRLLDLRAFDLLVGITRTNEGFGYVATGINGAQ